MEHHGLMETVLGPEHRENQNLMVPIQEGSGEGILFLVKHVHGWLRFHEYLLPCVAADLSFMSGGSQSDSVTCSCLATIDGDHYGLWHAVRDFLCEPPFLEYVKEKFQGLFVKGLTLLNGDFV